ncbi:MAG: phosphomannomutase/phosphoglucomutase [Alphaproteobacteria bacterium]|nr:phosphomannomutase/phosphoglucomutase [Alphaproteobacteria bacterium]MDD9919594.1 phosphomannomutase/phosphoglucomutase [Alphaproteobacteria bacterium]
MNFPKPQADLKPNTVSYEQLPLVKPTGFREYDARWLFEKEINLQGIQAVGLGMATLFRRKGVPVRLVVGHDFRSYSSSIKMALTSGLLAGGAEVFDIGLALSPMAYFAQFELDVEGVAMVTASHNDNGWTGIKMGMQRPVTFGPDEMSALKEIVLNGDFDEPTTTGKYHYVTDMAERYAADLTKSVSLKRKLKVVCACGNGTAGAFSPDVLRRAGCEVVELNCDLDHTFPNHNPNPEDMKMLHAVRDAVLEHKADIGLAFDGDGDRCGVVDNEGEELFADKVGVLLARDLSAQNENSTFVVDVKSTGLFLTDPILQENGAKTTYWKTGHSYIKRYCSDNNALAGFEKSGHFFFNAPVGRGYDDALVTALAVCNMLERNSDKTMADLRRSLPKTWQSPSMAPKCADEEKYGVIDRAVSHFSKIAESGASIAGQKVKEAITVNGIRLVLEDGTWGLVRASSNKPELVVVVESPTSEENMRAIFSEIDGFLSQQPEVGEYNQKI